MGVIEIRGLGAPGVDCLAAALRVVCTSEHFPDWADFRLQTDTRTRPIRQNGKAPGVAADGESSVAEGPHIVIELLEAEQQPVAPRPGRGTVYLGVFLGADRTMAVQVYSGMDAYYDGLYAWPGSAHSAAPPDQVAADFAFQQWLGLGIRLARARAETLQAREQLTLALLDTHRQLARELHSGPVQELVAGTFLTGLLPEGSGEPVLAQMQSALGDLRRICQRLNPPALDDFGLAAALRTAVQAQTRTHPGFSPEVNLAADPAALATAAAGVIYVIFERLMRVLLAASQVTVRRIDLAASDQVTYVSSGGLESASPRYQGKDVALTVEWLGPQLPAALDAWYRLARELCAAAGGQVYIHQTPEAGAVIVRMPAAEVN